MTSLKRSFLYALALFTLAALFILLIVMLWPAKKSKMSKTLINPAKFISKMQNPSAGDKNKEAKKRLTAKNENIDSQTKEVSKSQKKLINKNKQTSLTDKSISLPYNSELLHALQTLPVATQAQASLSPQEEMLKGIYGDELTKLSTKSKQYLIDNHLEMQKITQKVLNRIARVYLDPRFRYYNYNIIEFMFYPDGHIGTITILQDAGFNLLDKITKETIETAYKDYPRPSEPTLVRYRFLYDLRG